MKTWTDIEAAIEEADFEAAQRKRQMFVMQLNGSEMVITMERRSYSGRVMYSTRVGR